MSTFEKKVPIAVQTDRNTPVLRKYHRLVPSWLICAVPVPFWLFASLASSEFFATVAAAIGLGFAAVWWYYSIDGSEKMMQFLNLGAVSLLTYLNLGWLVSTYFNLVELDRSVEDILISRMGVSLSAYCAAVAFALAFASVVGFTAGLPLLRAYELRFAATLKALPKRGQLLWTLAVVFAALELTLLASGVISYRSYTTDGYAEGSLPWFVPLMEAIVLVHLILLSALLAGPIPRTISKRKVLSVLLLSIPPLFVLFTRGRTGLILGVLALLYFYCYFVGYRPKFRSLVLAALIAGPVIFFGSLLNSFMRGDESGLTQADLSGGGIAQSAGMALNVWRNNSDAREVERLRNAENLATRPLVAYPLARIFDLDGAQRTYMLGENILNSIVWTIPSALISDKEKFPIQENLLFANFSMVDEDIPDSLYLYSFAEFNVFGLLLYPALVLLIWAVNLVFGSIDSISAAVVASTWFPLFTIGMSESAFSAWTNTLRTMLILLLIFQAVRLFGKARRSFI